ncbi:hypothetical protein LPICM02_350050 [Pseudolactococcus piscium]|nr:hypothetical protein LPICM02_350050 [Lactococcus piscium]
MWITFFKQTYQHLFFSIHLVNKLYTSVTNFFKTVYLEGIKDKISVINPKVFFFYPHFPQTCV